MTSSETLSGGWWKPAPKPLPQLPPEIWQHIFQWATCVPGALDSGLVDPFRCSGFASRAEEHKLLRHSLVTKRYLVRVCKAWHTLATRYLYEIVIIGRCKIMPSLAETLSRSKRQSNISTGGTPLGWWTRRLDLAMRDPRVPEEGEDLGIIISCLPNLGVLVSRPIHSTYGGTTIPKPAVKALVDVCSPSIRALRMYAAQSFHDGDWESIYDMCTLLDAVDSYGSKPPRLPENARSVTVRVAWLIVEPVLAIPNNLEELRYIFRNHAPLAAELNLILSTSAAKSLKSLHLEFDTTFTGAHPDGAIKEKILSCPNLTQLVLKLYNLDSFTSFPFLPSTITHLGIQPLRKQPSCRQIRSFFAALAAHDVPELRTIRFTDRATCDNIRAICADGFRPLRSVLRLIQQRDWRVEDREGRPVLLA